MNTLVAVAISPYGTGEELSKEVAECVRIIRASNLNSLNISKTSMIYQRILPVE